MAYLRKLTFIALVCGTFSMAGAQNLNMQGTDGASADARPARGTTMANVESRYGSPNRKVDAVGEPPISRWEYSNMVIFFEHDRVIHAVLRR